MMEDTSINLQNEYEEQLKTIKEIEKKDNKYKTVILYSSFIIAFVVVFISTVMIVHNYSVIKHKNDNVHNIMVKDY